MLLVVEGERAGWGWKAATSKNEGVEIYKNNSDDPNESNKETGLGVSASTPPVVPNERGFFFNFANSRASDRTWCRLVIVRASAGGSVFTNRLPSFLWVGLHTKKAKSNEMRTKLWRQRASVPAKEIRSRFCQCAD